MINTESRYLCTEVIKKTHPYGLFIFLLTFLFSCGLETARPKKKQELIIASDFLNKNDLLLFRSFEEKNNISIRLKSMTADSIHRHLKAFGYASRIDLVFLRSSLDFCVLSSQRMLQPITHPDLTAQIPNKYKGKDENWFGVAIDPYILVHRKDSLSTFSNYKDLLKKVLWGTNLRNEDQFHALYASLLQRGKQNPELTASFLESLTARKNVLNKSIDSTFNYPPLLTTYSVFYSDTNLMRSKYKKAKLVFPNQKQGGTLYELRTIGMVKQASNYTNAKEFILYLTAEGNSQRINNWWNTFPVGNKLERSFEYQNQRFKLYSSPPHTWCDHLQQAKKSLEKK